MTNHGERHSPRFEACPKPTWGRAARPVLGVPHALPHVGQMGQTRPQYSINGAVAAAPVFGQWRRQKSAPAAVGDSHARRLRCQ